MMNNTTLYCIAFIIEVYFVDGVALGPTLIKKVRGFTFTVVHQPSVVERCNDEETFIVGHNMNLIKECEENLEI